MAIAFNDNLLRARLEAEMTQEQLAKNIGVGRTTVNGYEKGNIEPSLHIFLRIIKLFGLGHFFFD